MAPEPGAISRREALGRLGLIGFGLTGSASILGACGGSESSGEPSTTSSPGPAGGKPNLLLVVADDMRLDQLTFMPKVQQLIQEPGRTFAQARCNVPLCQPSAWMSGWYLASRG